MNEDIIEIVEGSTKLLVPKGSMTEKVPPKEPNRIIDEEIQKLQTNFEILQRIDLKPFDKDHAMIIARSID